MCLSRSLEPARDFPVGDAAARDEDRPILLSVGYSACHWCHVMERESFEDPTVAAVMNELFVSIRWTVRSARTSTRCT